MRRRRRESSFSLFSFQDIITSVTGIMILITLVLAIELIERTKSSPKEMTRQTIEQLRSQIIENEKEIRSLETRLGASQPPSSQLAVLDAATLRSRLEERREQNAILSKKVVQAERRRNTAVRRQSEVESRDKQRRATEERQQDNLKQQIIETNETITRLITGKRVVFNRAKGFSRNAWIVQISAGRILVALIGRKKPPLSFANKSAFRSWTSSRDASADYFLLVVKPDGIEPFESLKDNLRSSGFSVGYDLIGADQTAVDPQLGAGTP